MSNINKETPKQRWKHHSRPDTKNRTVCSRRNYKVAPAFFFLLALSLFKFITSLSLITSEFLRRNIAYAPCGCGQSGPVINPSDTEIYSLRQANKTLITRLGPGACIFFSLSLYLLLSFGNHAILQKLYKHATIMA